MQFVPLTGDEILTTRNDYKLGVLNGTRATIEQVDDHGRIHARASDGRAVDLPPEYAERGHVTHGYAMTFHKAQGATVGETFVLGTEGLAARPPRPRRWRSTSTMALPWGSEVNPSLLGARSG